MERILCVIIGYLFGAIIQSGYWLCKWHGVDIRTVGSGNAGTTNVIRAMGKKIGYLTYICDMGKVLLSFLVCRALFGGNLPAIVIAMYSGLGAVLGHDYPFYLHFKGGKGIASTTGVIISLVFIRPYFAILIVLGFLTFICVMYSSRYVSLASMFLTCGFAIEFVIFALIGLVPAQGGNLAEVVIIPIVLALLSVYQHRGNIQRLRNGSERKIRDPKKKRENKA
jgi:glycerol-3-phosphate acyltransferase PlsY